MAPRGWFATFCVELHWYFHISKIRGAKTELDFWLDHPGPSCLGAFWRDQCQGASVKSSRCNMVVAPASLQLHPWAPATRKKHHLVLVSCPVSMGPSPWFMICPLDSNIRIQHWLFFLPPLWYSLIFQPPLIGLFGPVFGPVAPESLSGTGWPRSGALPGGRATEGPTGAP